MSSREEQTRSGASMSQLIIEAIAEEEGVSPTEVTPPLYEVINPDALNKLFSADQRGQISFTYRGYEVTANQNRECTVQLREER